MSATETKTVKRCAHCGYAVSGQRKADGTLYRHGPDNGRGSCVSSEFVESVRIRPAKPKTRPAEIPVNEPNVLPMPFLKPVDIDGMREAIAMIRDTLDASETLPDEAAEDLRTYVDLLESFLPGGGDA